MLLSERGWRQEHGWLFGCGYCQPLFGGWLVLFVTTFPLRLRFGGV